MFNEIRPLLIVGVMGILVSIMLITLSSAAEDNVCCEKTKTGLFCQDVTADKCATGSRQVPSSCESTSYCKLGYCYDSSEGTCIDKTPETVCNANNGTWSATKPAQCDLGCCVLGDQASLVSLTRCKRLSSLLGLQTNYRKDITNEVQCIFSVKSQDKGACVYEEEFQKKCKITTRGDCSSGSGTNQTKEFHPGKLCTSEEIGSICGPTEETTCVAGKDGVYFKDTCGNVANIYDASKIKDKEYWNNMKSPEETCNPNAGNANSASCGNCNYASGSLCRAVKREDRTKPTYGNNICKDLNCYDTKNGNDYKHGESWCVFQDAGKQKESDNAVGSRFYKHICSNGEEIVEQCADFRQEECIEEKIDTGNDGTFSQAACRVNRWQDCLAQAEKVDCENTDRRDCTWKTDESLFVVKYSNISGDKGVCVPKVTPGLQFWNGEQAKDICSQANIRCNVKFEKGLFGEEKCVENCECLVNGWARKQAEFCSSLGDCGIKVNWQDQKGYKEGYKVVNVSQ